ncbi:MAG TPA: Fic family protein [Iamia sp.]|nr:Fic family protein [Iamia sp.]
MDAEELRRALEAADAAYEPFPAFSEWASEPIALGSWDDAASHLASVREAASVEEVTTRIDEVLRGAAVDTGAIEGLYPADRGFTWSVARNKISLDQAEVEAGLGFRRSFEAQLAGFELAFHRARGGEVITEAAIREIHRVTCADDSTYQVQTDHGVQQRTLVLGSYKTETNHVVLADGSWHAYAPVDRVPEEMHRLVEEMRSELFRSAPTVVQAAFVQHAFTSVHPFADGNGRVARLLASIPLLRAASIPLWVEVSDRPRYFDALESADGGDRQPLLRFVTSTTLGLLRELILTIETPLDRPPPALEAPAAVTAAETLAREIGTRLRELPSAYLEFPVTAPRLVPAGVTVPEGASMLVRGAPAYITGCPVSVGFEPAADTSDRFAVLVHGDIGGPGGLERVERFSADELLPRLTPAAERRLGQIARLIVHEARRPGPT